jgi:alpha-amylase
LAGRFFLAFIATTIMINFLYQSAFALVVVLLCAGCAQTPDREAVSSAVAESRKPSFAENPIVYFAITDRFYNGNSANDQSYGRQKDGKDEIGTFHGGDLAGLTAKLKAGYFNQLGINALWITAPYEQIHGWVQGGNAEFKHYAYHGYYALDFTRLDRNMGTPDELREFVDTAHARGIRVLFDVVMNHPGYADIQTLSEYLPELLWKGWERYTLKNYHKQINYNSFDFGKWWGGDWVRSGLPGYPEGGGTDLTKQLAYLPDFRTDSNEAVRLPFFLKERKKDTAAVDLPNTPVRGYLVRWLSDWVSEYGIDGFRCDTVKHVDNQAWDELKDASTKALVQWKQKNPDKRIDDSPFWMVGEVFPHGVERSGYFDHGFDSLINFDFQGRKLADAAALDAVYDEYATALAAGRAGGKNFDVMSYISSHDTSLYPRDQLREAGSALLLVPGGVQIFYGDETARLPGPATSSDPQQATRSDMNWASINNDLLAHWQKLGTFRSQHPAVAQGTHKRLSIDPYVFSRQSGSDIVVAVPKASGQVVIPVGGAFKNGTKVRDAYSGRETVVANGTASLVAQGTVLLEVVR